MAGCDGELLDRGIHPFTGTSSTALLESEEDFSLPVLVYLRFNLFG